MSSFFFPPLAKYLNIIIIIQFNYYFKIIQFVLNCLIYAYNKTLRSKNDSSVKRVAEKQRHEGGGGEGGKWNG